MGILCIGIFTRFGKNLGTMIFRSELSGSFITVLCWLCPFMYLATTMGSIQNGLGKTGTTFLQNIVAMGIRLAFVIFAVPVFGIRGYLWGFALFISMGIDRVFCAAIPVTGSVVTMVFRMGIITACYGMFLGVILR